MQVVAYSIGFVLVKSKSGRLQFVVCYKTKKAYGISQKYF